MITRLIAVFSFILFGGYNTIEAQYLGRKKYKQLTNDDFKEKIDLMSKPLEVNEGKLVSPRGIIILEDYLLISDGGTQKHIHIIDIKEKKYLGLYIDYGTGPHELSSLSVFEKINNTSCLLFDYFENKYVCFTIDELLNSSTSFANGKTGEKEFPKFLNYDKENNTLFSAAGFTHTHLLYEKDLNSGKTIGHEEQLQPETGLNTPEVRFHLSASQIERHNSHFVFAYVWSPILEIFDFKNKKLISAIVPHHELPKYRAKSSDGVVNVGIIKDSTYEYSDVAMSDRYVYALYNRHTLVNDEPEDNSIIYVFDYKLNPIKMYNLDTYCTSVSVLDDTLIYGLNSSKVYGGEGKIVVYDIDSKE